MGTYKSTTVFNYCKINSKIIDYVTDTTLNKQESLHQAHISK